MTYYTWKHKSYIALIAQTLCLEKVCSQLYEEWKVKVDFMVVVSMMILKYIGTVIWGKERSFKQFNFEELGDKQTMLKVNYFKYI